MNSKQENNSPKNTATQLKMLKMRTANSIGLLVFEFNQLERDFGELLAAFLKRSSQDEHFDNISIMSSALSFGQKIDLLSALYLKRYKNHPPQCEIFKKTTSQIFKFETLRNTIIHSQWDLHVRPTYGMTRSKSTTRGGKGLKNQKSPANWKYIREICQEMREINNVELFHIYIGCSSTNIMTTETINELNTRLDIRTQKIFNKSI